MSNRPTARERVKAEAAAIANGTARKRPAPAPVPPDKIDPCTDLANARRFAADHAADARYSHPEGRWYVWDGRRWTHDETGAAVVMAKRTAATLLGEAAELVKVSAAKDDPPLTAEAVRLLKWAQKTQQARGIENMLSLARSEPSLVVLPAQFDADPWALNVSNGTLDLRTATLRPHRREDLLTALCPTQFDPAARCPEWERFLAAVFAGDGSMVRYVQRVLGYCLTGDTSVAVLVVFWGGGSNGKSTLVELAFAVLGPDYTAKAAPDLLMLSQGDRHPTELADLKGRRLVVAMETEEGRRLNESLIKELTGGDTIRARRMREDFWEFSPTHKLILGTNHKPRVRTGGHGLWRRLRLMPFAVRFWRADEGESGPPHLKADRQLKGKLLAEAPGILAWMVRGCLEWQAEGRDLATPKPVLAATAEFREEEDIFARYLDGRCERHPTAKTSASDLYAAFVAWCEQEGEKPLSRKAVGERLGAAGLEKGKSHGTVVYHGIRILQVCRGRIGGGSEAETGMSAPPAPAKSINPEMASDPPPILPAAADLFDEESYFGLPD